MENQKTKAWSIFFKQSLAGNLRRKTLAAFGPTHRPGKGNRWIEYFVSKTIA
jgi:hypothetical protein